MAELTSDERKALESTVMEKLYSEPPANVYEELLEIVSRTAVRAAITTIQEYNKLKGQI